jgi:hypothetical protein
MLLGTMVMRWLLWGLVWIVTGSHFWLLPNMTSETVSWAWPGQAGQCRHAMHGAWASHCVCEGCYAWAPKNYAGPPLPPIEGEELNS